MTTALARYDYALPEELIAKRPPAVRGGSRLMVVEKETGSISQLPFSALPDFLKPGDGIVFNNTKVIPARLKGCRPGGGRAEILLVEQVDGLLWKAMVRPGRKLQEGAEVIISDELFCRVMGSLPDGLRLIAFEARGSLWELLERWGELPLPNYIRRPFEKEMDCTRYQTVFAEVPGAIAAPTAALHFTPEMLALFQERAIDQVMVTLHVGPGTFLPVRAADIRDHVMHAERFHISQGAAERLNHFSKEQRVITVGTTCCRTLEAATGERGNVFAGEGKTNLFIYPGYQFRYVRSLLTNFHLPKSTLLMLVCAFAGHELTMEAYRKAVEWRFRFYSYGDAMLII